MRKEEAFRPMRKLIKYKEAEPLIIRGAAGMQNCMLKMDEYSVVSMNCAAQGASNTKKTQ